MDFNSAHVKLLTAQEDRINLSTAQRPSQSSLLEWSTAGGRTMLELTNVEQLSVACPPYPGCYHLILMSESNKRKFIKTFRIPKREHSKGCKVTAVRPARLALLYNPAHQLFQPASLRPYDL